MAIEALSTAWSDASLFNREHGDQDFSFKGKGSMSALQWLADAAPDLVKREQREPDPFTAYEENRAGEAGGPLSYSRRITANIHTGQDCLRTEGAVMLIRHPSDSTRRLSA